MPIGTPVGNLDIANATLRTSNLETQNIKIGSIFVNSYPGLETTANVGNSMSNTIQFTNTHTAFTTTGNVTVGGELTVSGFVGSSGTGALTVPAGTTVQRPTAANGMIRYNSETGFMEAYSGGVWAPIAQPPTVTSISPVSVLLADTATQVFTVTGTGIVSGSTVQLEGADGTLYSVVDATPPNADGTQVTFKMQPSGSSSGTVYPDIDMTSASQGGYVVTAHTEGSGSEAMWKAFDGNSSSTHWKVDNGYSTSGSYFAVAISGVLPSFTDTAGTAHVGHWIQLELPKKIKLTRFVTAANFANQYFMKSYVVLGSNDNTSWTLLHSEANGTGVQDVTTLSGGSTSFFKYFKLLVKSKLNGSSAHLQIGEVEYYGILYDGRFEIAQQPYKVRINSTSGLSGVSTAVIGFAVGWTSPAADANLEFYTIASATHTLAGTDGAGGTNRTFSVAPGSNALPSGLTLTGSTGVINGTMAVAGTTSVTFRLTDNATGLFTDRAINIVGLSGLYSFTSHTFNRGAQTASQINGGNAQGDTAGFTKGPTFAQMKTEYASEIWEENTAWFNEVSGKQGFQLWTVPESGTYRITVKGARGGLKATNNGALITPGNGAHISADFTFTYGTKLVIIVGQTGRQPNQSQSSGSGSGGGGASWVLKENFTTSNNDVYMVAAGGNGLRSNSSGPNANGSSQGVLGAGGSAGTAAGAGGGAGWTGNGGYSSSAYGDHTGGFSPANGAKGGLPSEYSSYASEGGFGGGGGNGFGTFGGGGAGASGGRTDGTTVATSYIMPNGTGGITVTNRTFSGNHTDADGSVYIQAPGTF